ncbi:protein Erd1p [[Candida] anglica]|uniref:Protein Erd1p n=1 Tax=[Candida] anglica TaxID=148631 RepID=A0ABP0E7T8_9ASCO
MSEEAKDGDLGVPSSWPEYPTLVPLPFKIIALIHLSVYLWYLVARINYHKLNMNTLQLINLSYSKHSYAQLDSYLPHNGEYATTTHADFKENKQLILGIWNLFKKLSVVIFGSYTGYQVLGVFYDTNIVVLIPLITLMTVVYYIFPPNSSSIGLHRCFTTLKRILVGRINSRTMRTNDILISDTLVSFNRVINDFVLLIWITIFGMERAYSPIMEFSALSIPVIIRIKQCWYEYHITGARQHLLNLIKYSTNFGPMVITVLIKYTNLNREEGVVSEEELSAKLAKLSIWWFFFATINSTYSFVWDIKMDWGLRLFDRMFGISHSSTDLIETTLRPSNQLLGPVSKYVAVIVLDFILRFIWILKWFNSPTHVLGHLGLFFFSANAHQFGFCALEMLEILRRWMWVFLKLESDWFKQQTQAIEMDLVKEN